MSSIRRAVSRPDIDTPALLAHPGVDAAELRIATLPIALTCAGSAMLGGGPTRTAHPWQRLRAVRELWGAGVNAGVLMAPVVPGPDSSALHAHHDVRGLPFEIGIHPASPSRVHHLDEVHRVPFGIDE